MTDKVNTPQGARYFVRDGSGGLYRLHDGLMRWDSRAWVLAPEYAVEEFAEGGALGYEEISPELAGLLTVPVAGYQAAHDAAQGFLSVVSSSPTLAERSAFAGLRRRALHPVESPEERSHRVLAEFATDEVYHPGQADYDPVMDALMWAHEAGTISDEQFETLSSSI